MGGEEALAGVLRTKLYAPRLPEIIPREKLLKELAAARNAKLTTVVAGAGYGKSTLAAAFLASGKAPFVWYQLEDTDRDLSEFITYLVAGIMMHDSGFGEETLGRMQAAENIAGESRAILSTLISEMDARMKDDFFVVLDDFQQVNGSPQITGALEFLIGHLPPNLHLVILSREKPDLDLDPLAARRELVEIAEDDLRFSLPETNALYGEVLGLPLEDEEARSLCEHTEGWITGLVLFWLAVRDRERDKIGEALGDLKVPPARVAAYLSGVVFESQSEQVREFTMKTSLLARMNPGFCDRLLGIKDSGTILDHLADSRLFTIPLDDRGGWYRYHHLLQAFLKERLSGGYSEEEIKQLNMKAAALWEKQGEFEQAIHHYLEACEYDKAAQALEEMAPRLMKASRVSFLLDNLIRLPEKTLEKRPWLVFDHAKILDLSGEYAEAMEGYQLAADLFGEKGDVENKARSLINRGWLLGVTGKAGEAAECLTEGIELLPPDSRIRRKTVAIMSTEYATRGYFDASIRYQSEAIEGIDDLEDEASLATVLLWCGMASYFRGNIRQSSELFLRAYEMADRIGLDALLPHLYPYLESVLTLRGRLDEALDFAKKGLSLSEKLYYRSRVFISLFNKAVALALLGEKEEALRDVEKMIEMSRGFGAGLDVSFAEVCVGITYMICGDHGQSIRHFEKSERISEQSNYRTCLLLARLLMIWQSAPEVDIDASRQEVTAIAEAFKEPGAGFFDISHDLVLALLEVMAGREEEARRYFETAVELTERYEALGAWWEMWYGKEAPRLLPLVSELFSRGEHLEYLEYAFSSVGTESIPYLKELEKSENKKVRDKAREVLKAIARETAEPLEVRMLGPFEVVRGGERISPEDWRSKRALAVMKYLAAQDERRSVPRDVLMELLWPSSTPESASKNLGMALSSLRRTLEPGAARGESSYLVASGEALRLELGRGGWTDFRLFRKRISEAGEARMLGDDDIYLDKLQGAEGLYRGDFLADDPYEDWCMPERDRLRDEYLELLLNLTDEHTRRGDNYAALSYIVKAVLSDPGREDLCRKQMDIYARMGDRAGVERSYQRLSDYLREEFAVEPSPETVELYRGLRGN